jgi:hypothetical protein
MHNAPSPRTVLYTCKLHWIVLIKYFVVYLLATLISLGLFTLAGIVQQQSIIITEIVLILALALVSFIHHWFFMEIITWELSKIVVNAKKVFILKNKPFLHDQSTQINIQEIDEIEHTQSGFLENILNYGSLSINIAASPIDIVLTKVACPSELERIIESIQAERWDDLNINSV